MFNRHKDEERTELDAAWEDEAPKPYFAGAAPDDAAPDSTAAEQTEDGHGEPA